MELAIDTVGPTASVALSDEGRVVVELTWPAGRRHTPTLVPMIDQACRFADIERPALRAVFVDTGPGAYGGIRSGMAAATALALALDIPALGVGRLEIEAYAQAATSGLTGGVIAALHAAGRRQWALALYRGPAEAWTELAPPSLHPAPEIVEAVADARRRTATPATPATPAATAPHAGVLTGELDALLDDDRQTLLAEGWTLASPAAGLRRAGLLAELGWRRLQAGGDFSPQRLEPLYLREPAIGPQPPPTEARTEPPDQIPRQPRTSRPDAGNV